MCVFLKQHTISIFEGKSRITAISTYRAAYFNDGNEGSFRVQRPLYPCSRSLRDLDPFKQA